MSEDRTAQGSQIACVNGRFSPLAQARVSVEDRGFQFADGVYEALVAYDGRPFRLRQHLERLAVSARGIRLDYDPLAGELERIVREGIGRVGHPDVHVYIQITRGVAPRHHDLPRRGGCTVVAVFKKKPEVPEAWVRDGLRVVTLPDPRWRRCDLKTIALLPNVLARAEAQAAGADDALFVDGEGAIQEATAANVFAVRGGQVRTPPRSPRLLSGITREFVLELARTEGLDLDEAPIRTHALGAVDEMFLTSTTLEVVGVVGVDGRRVGAGGVGPVTRRLRQAFQARVRRS